VVVYMHYLDECNPSWEMYVGRYDRVVNEAKANHLQVQMVLTGVAAAWGTPCAGKPPSGQRPSPGTVAAFVHTWVPHYNQMGVTRFSIWNEPNYPAFLCAGAVVQKAGVDSARCTASKKASALLLRKIYSSSYKVIQELKKVKQVSRNTQIFIGETAGVDTKFMTYLFSGKKFVADGFSVHPYEYCQNPQTKKLRKGCGRVMSGISYVGKVQAMLAKLHQAKKFTTPAGNQVPMWLTEFGYWRTTSVGLPEPVRAQWYPLALDAALKSGARGMNLYQLWESKPGSWDTSILDANGNGRSSFYAIRKWTKAHKYHVAAI